MTALDVLLSGLVVGESPRWHEDRLWFSHWGAREVVAVDLAGKREVMARVPVNVAFSIDWLPDGRLLIVAGPENRLLRQEPDGSLVDHVDLSGLDLNGLNEIVVDGRGNIYVNGGGEYTNSAGDFEPGPSNQPGGIALITPEGSVRQVAGDIAFPNGMVVTPDNSTLIISESFAGRLTAFDIEADGGLSNRRVWAENVGPDGICMDADGTIWTGVGVWGDHEIGRVREGGEVLDRIRLDRDCFACMLGGPDGRTLFMLAAEWKGLPNMFDEPYTGQLLTASAPAPGVGFPAGSRS